MPSNVLSVPSEPLVRLSLVRLSGACITFFLDPLLPVPFMALEPVPKVKADINELHHHWLPITWVRPTASYIPKAAAFLLRNISCHEASESVRFFKNSNSQEVDSL